MNVAALTWWKMPPGVAPPIEGTHAKFMGGTARPFKLAPPTLRKYASACYLYKLIDLW